MKVESFIHYVNPTELGAPAKNEAAPKKTGRIGSPIPGYDLIATDSGYEFSKVVNQAVSNGSLQNAEVDVLKSKIAAVKTARELRDVYLLMSDAVNAALIRLRDRRELEVAMLRQAEQIEGGHDVVSPAVTEAVGEDIFGMGALELTPIEHYLWEASENDVISDKETAKIVASLENADDKWALWQARGALGFTVNGNSITAQNRQAIAEAFHGAAERLGEGVAVTKAMNEDVFGVRPTSNALDLIAKAKANGVIHSIEAHQLADAIRGISDASEVARVFDSLDRAVEASLLQPKVRKELAEALEAANRKSGGKAFPPAPIQPDADIFGRRPPELTRVERRAIQLTDDATITKKNTSALLEDLSSVNTKDEMKAAFSALRIVAGLNMITKDQRARLVEGVLAAAERSGSPLAQTRGPDEDVFGHYPPI